MKTYSYNRIAKAVRAQYAENRINRMSSHQELCWDENAMRYIQEYRCDTPDGEYATRIFKDIFAHTGINVLDRKGADGSKRSYANLRKRLIDVRTSYAAASKKEYVPQAFYREMIARYTHCSSWEELCETAEDMIEEEEAFFSDIENGYCKLNLSSQMMDVSSVTKGNLLYIRFMNGEEISFVAMGNREFRIFEGKAVGLRRGDALLITDRIIKGNRISATIQSTGMDRYSDIWLSEGCIRSFSILSYNECSCRK